MRVLRKMAAHLIKRAGLQDQKGFTLLELLVVVAILAIIAGGIAVAYNGLESQSGKGAAAHGIAALDNAVRTFSSVRRTSPDNLDSLLAADPGSDGDQDVASITGGALVKTLTVDKLGPKDNGTGGKVEVKTLNTTQLSALNKAGITKLRYIDSAGNAITDATFPLVTDDLSGLDTNVKNIRKADIPVRIFDAPRATGNNRGRGYSHTLTATSPVAVWKPGTGSENNIKLGARADDVLIAFGLGNNSTMYTADQTAVGDVTLSQAPVYSDVNSKWEYARYILLYNVGSYDSAGNAIDPFAKAKLQAVVDAKGDFLDEEIAEYSGQKQ